MKICAWCGFPETAGVVRTFHPLQKCICMDWWKPSFLGKVSEIARSIDPKSDLKITTMTSLLNISSLKPKEEDNHLIDLQFLEEHCTIIDLQNSDDSKGSKPNKFSVRGKPIKTMYNCAHTGFKITHPNGCVRNIGLKIYPNGPIHITGANHPLDIIYVGKLVLRALKETCVINGSGTRVWAVPDPEDLYIQDNIQIVLINATFHTGIPIRQTVFQRIMNESGYTSVYKPDKYSGINIQYPQPSRSDDQKSSSGKKIKKTTNILAFNTGSIVLTSCRNLVELESVYRFIHGFIQKHRQEIQNHYIL